MRSEYDQTGLKFPGMQRGGEAARRFLHCPDNDEWVQEEHTPESLPEMHIAGHTQQHCRFCGLPLSSRIIDSTYRYGRHPLLIIEWP